MAARGASNATAAAASAAASCYRRALIAPSSATATSSRARAAAPTVQALLLQQRGLATATVRDRGRDQHGRRRQPSMASPDVEVDGLARRLIDEELARKEEASNAWRAGVISSALALVRRQGDGISEGAHRQALLTLGGYAPHLHPEDAVQVVRKALELGGLGQVAFAALVELRRMAAGRVVLLREADALVAAACKGGRVRMAAMVVEDVQRERAAVPAPSNKAGKGRRLPVGVEEAEGMAVDKPFISRASYLAFLRRLQQKGRPRSYWQLAESLLTYKGRPGAAVLGGDAEATGHAMVVCWRAGKWRAVQRLLRALEAEGGVRPQLQKDEDEDRATLRGMEALFTALERDQQGPGVRGALTTEHCNMLLHARLRAGERDGAVALVEEMMADAGSGPLPPVNALSVCLVLEALGWAGEWEACLRLLQGAKEALPAMDKAGLAMVYKTAIAAAGKAGLWEGCLSLFYELHERGLPPDLGTYTALLKALRTAGRLDALKSFLDAMPAQNVSPGRGAYNVLFAALGSEGLVDEALACFQRMQDEGGLSPTAYDYGTLIAGCGHAVRRAGANGEVGVIERMVATARRLLEEAERAVKVVGGGDRGLANCYVQMLKVYGKAGRWAEARALLAEMRPAGVEPSFSHYYEAMRAAAFAGEKAAALELLAEVEAATAETPHILCWNAAVLACSEARDPDGCLALLDQMRSKGLEPGAINYARTLSALGRAGRLGEALQLMVGVRGKGVLDRAAYGALIAACGAVGGEEGAKGVRAVLEEMRVDVAPDALTVAQAVAALARGCGRIEEAEALLLTAGAVAEKGKEGAGPPSLLAYHALMLEAAVRGDRAKAKAQCEGLLAAMVERHGLCPTPVTRTLLVAAQCSDEALAAVDAFLPHESNELSLEAACRGVERALALNPHDERRRTLHRSLGQV